MQAKTVLRYISLTLGLLLLPTLTPLMPSQIKQSPAASRASKPPDAPDEVVRLQANLVTVPTTVMDRNERYITGLRKEDFQIFEDGVEQEVAFFAPVEQPFTTLFLLDTSASMGCRLTDLAQAANAFLSQLRPDDRVIAASFDDRIRIICDLTSIKQIREGKKFRLNPGGNTMLYDAVDDAFKRMKKLDGRKAIVLFSDGFGTGYFATAKSNLRDAEEQDDLIYTVQFQTYSTEPPRQGISREAYFKEIEAANSYMLGLAQKTGGRHYQVENISNLSTTFGQVAAELRQQYSLGYYPKQHLEPGQYRKIKVKVRRPDLIVRARSSYLVGPDRKPHP